MFELVQKHPPHWPPFVPPAKPEVTTTGAGAVRAGTAGVRQHLPGCTDHRGNQHSPGVKRPILMEHQTVPQTGHVTAASTDVLCCWWFVCFLHLTKYFEGHIPGKWGVWFVVLSEQNEACL